MGPGRVRVDGEPQEGGPEIRAPRFTPTYSTGTTTAPTTHARRERHTGVETHCLEGTEGTCINGGWHLGH